MDKKPKPDDEKQSQRFIDEARKIQSDSGASKEFGRAFDVIMRVPAKSGKHRDKDPSRKKRR